MKKATLYLFLFTYATVMFKPVMPYFTDIVAHVFFFKDHMLTAHAHHGKFHVHFEVAEAAKNDQSGKSTNNFKKDSFSSEHIITDTYTFLTLAPLINWPVFLSAPANNAFIMHDYPPPRF